MTSFLNSSVGAVLFLSTFFVAQAGAQVSKTELLVRIKSDRGLHQMLGAFGSASTLDGDLKTIRAATPAALEKIRKQLSQSAQVDRISPNFLYRPALHVSVKLSEPVRSTVWSARDFGMGSVIALLGEVVLGSGVPDVLLPPQQKSGSDPLLSQDWAMSKIGFPNVEMLDFTKPQSQLITAVIDTGIDYNHEDLIAALWRNPNDAKEIGYDFAHNSNKPYDIVQFDVEGCFKDPSCATGADQSKFIVNPGHGTHCAGHVGAMANNSLGIEGVGSKTLTQIMGLKFFYDVGEEKAGQGDDVAAIKSIDYAIRNGAKIISASWGGRVDRDDAEKSELKDALIRARDAGVLVIIAAGNDGVDQDEIANPSYPAAYDLDNIVTVAATDQNDNLADFSSYGLKSVHIGAPGVKILSTTVGNKYADVIAKFHTSSGKEAQVDWNGTSMATPIVAGAAALIWAKHPGENYHQIRDRILKNARPVNGLAGKVSSGGVLDVSAALK